MQVWPMRKNSTITGILRVVSWARSVGRYGLLKPWMCRNALQARRVPWAHSRPKCLILPNKPMPTLACTRLDSLHCCIVSCLSQMLLSYPHDRYSTLSCAPTTDAAHSTHTCDCAFSCSLSSCTLSSRSRAHVAKCCAYVASLLDHLSRGANTYHVMKNDIYCYLVGCTYIF